MIPVSIRSLDSSVTADDGGPLWRQRKFIIFVSGLVLLLLVVGVIATALLSSPAATTSSNNHSIFGGWQGAVVSVPPANDTVHTTSPSLLLFGYPRRTVLLAAGIASTMVMTVVVLVVVLVVVQSNKNEAVLDRHDDDDDDDETTEPDTQTGHAEILSTRNIAIGIGSVVVLLGVTVGVCILRYKSVQCCQKPPRKDLGGDAVPALPVHSPDTLTTKKDPQPPTSQPDVSTIKDLKCRQLYDELVAEYNHAYDQIMVDFDHENRQKYADTFDKFPGVQNLLSSDKRTDKWYQRVSLKGIHYTLQWMYYKGRAAAKTPLLVIKVFFRGEPSLWDDIAERTYAQKVDLYAFAVAGNEKFLGEQLQVIKEINQKLSGEHVNTVEKLYQFLQKYV